MPLDDPGRMAAVTVRLPLQLKGVDEGWLTEALSLRQPGLVVDEIVEREELVGSATKVMVTLRYDGDARDRPPERLCVKGGFDERQRMVGGLGFAVEARFFADIAERMPVPVPRCYFAATDGSPGGQSIVILEDLRARDVTFGSPLQALTSDTAAATLELMARWHGTWWDRKGLDHATWLTVGSPALQSVIGVLTSSGHWDLHMAQPKADPVPEQLRDRGRVRVAMSRLWEFDEVDRHTLLHGDTHIGNMYYEPDGAPRFLDWQSVMVGPWSHDVANFLAGALAVEDRRVHEHELIRHYLDALRAGGGPDIAFDEAWLGYRRHVLHGFLWVLTPEEMQPVAFTAAMAERYSAAADDLEVLEALA
jgi:hypothetical protein